MNQQKLKQRHTSMACGVQEQKNWALKLKLVSPYNNNQTQIESL